MRHIVHRCLSRGRSVAQRRGCRETHTVDRRSASGRTPAVGQHCSCCLCMNSLGPAYSNTSTMHHFHIWWNTGNSYNNSCNNSKTVAPATSKGSSWKIYGGPSLTWSDLWKNRPVMQNPKAAAAAEQSRLKLLTLPPTFTNTNLTDSNVFCLGFNNNNN